MAEIARLLARLPHGFPTPIALMIGALALVFGGAAAAFVGLGGVRTGQICRVGDTVRDTAWRRRRGRARLGHAAGDAPGAERAALSAKPSDRPDAGCSRPGVLRHDDRDGGRASTAWLVD